MNSPLWRRWSAALFPAAVAMQTTYDADVITDGLRQLIIADLTATLAAQRPRWWALADQWDRLRRRPTAPIAMTIAEDNNGRLFEHNQLRFTVELRRQPTRRRPAR